jgi:PAS domain S-box-containing protein
MDNTLFDRERSELHQILADIDFDMPKAFDLVPVIVWVSNPLAQCIFLNKMWYDITGQTPETGLGKGWQDCIHPEDVNYINNVFKNIHEGKLFSFEYRIRNRNGKYRWYFNSGQPQFDKAGNFKGFIGSAIDIHDRKKAEEDLKKTVNHYKTFAEAMPAMAFIADAGGNIIYFNKRWYEFTGINEGSDGWGWIHQSIHHPDDLQKTLDAWNHSLQTGENYEIEYRLRRHDGEYLWHLAKALPLRDYKGDIELWLGTNTEIDSLKKAENALKTELEERKAIEEQLQQERELFLAIFDNIPVMLSIWDPRINISHLNKAFTEVTGWTKEDYTATSIMELAYPDPQYRKWVAEYMSSLAPGFKDVKMATKDGRIVDSEWNNIQISQGRNVGIGLDVSERRTFERKLSELSQQLHSVVENITDGVLVYKPDGQLIRENKAAETLLDLVHYHKTFDFDDFIMCDVEGNPLEKYHWPLFRVMQGESFIRQEYLVKNKISGEEIFIEYSGIPVTENEQLQLIIITLHDVTQKRRDHINLLESNNELKIKNEQLEKINNLHENLFYIIAHDLRNPIGNMYLVIDLIKRVNDSNEKEKFTGMLREMVRRQENIVLGLVELLEVQSPEKVNPAEIDVEELVRNILRDHDAILRECGADVILDLPDGFSFSYVPSFLESILKNLINNAIKYRKESKQLVLKISGADMGEFALVALEDNGIGINMNLYKKNLFQPFKRYTRQSEGTGMGLYLVKNLIEKNGGFIELDSEEGKGSTFKCWFRKY